MQFRKVMNDGDAELGLLGPKPWVSQKKKVPLKKKSRQGRAQIIHFMPPKNTQIFKQQKKRRVYNSSKMPVNRPPETSQASPQNGTDQETHCRDSDSENLNRKGGKKRQSDRPQKGCWLVESTTSLCAFNFRPMAVEKKRNDC